MRKPIWWPKNRHLLRRKASADDQSAVDENANDRNGAAAIAQADSQPATVESPSSELADSQQPNSQQPNPQQPEPQQPEPQQPEPSPAEPDPQFGLLDVIEAFTALRQESRTQTRESRTLANSIEQSIARIEGFGDQVSAAIQQCVEQVQTSASEDTARRLADALVELDWNLSRAVEIVIRANSQENLAESPQPSVDTQGLKQAVDQALAKRGPIFAWFCKPAIEEVYHEIDHWATGQHPGSAYASFYEMVKKTAKEKQTVNDGMRLLLDRVRRLLDQQGIEKIDTTGQPFDGEKMNAVEAVESSEYPPGYVVEQLRPAYRWREKLIQYAEVRVAR